jgi:hypothetical protein
MELRIDASEKYKRNSLYLLSRTHAIKVKEHISKLPLMNILPHTSTPSSVSASTSSSTTSIVPPTAEAYTEISKMGNLAVIVGA